MKFINNKLLLDHYDYTTVGTRVDDLDTDSSCVIVTPTTTNDAISGFSPSTAESGELKWIINNHATNNLVLRHNASSTAGQRIFVTTGADLTIAPHQQALLMYVDAAARPGWWVMN